MRLGASRVVRCVSGPIGSLNESNRLGRRFESCLPDSVKGSESLGVSPADSGRFVVFRKVGNSSR